MSFWAKKLGLISDLLIIFRVEVLINKDNYFEKTLSIFLSFLT